MPVCSFCKTAYEFPKGTSVVQKDGTVRYYCSSKCRKNSEMGRDNRKVKWIKKKKNRVIIRTLFFSLIGVILILSFVSSAVNSSLMYPESAINHHRTGYTPYKGNITNPGILWEYVYTGQSNYFQIWAVADDINNDGIVETCISARDNYVRCLNALNGTEVWNASMGAGTMGIVSPTIADLFNDGQKQVIQGNREARFFVFNGTNGQQLWNISLPGGTTGSAPGGGPVPVNLTGDAEKEILFPTVSGTGAGLYAVLNNGTNLWNYSGKPVWQAPALGDMTGDGVDEIVFTFGTNITILFKNGTFYNTMKLSLPEPMDDSLYDAASVALADINSDGSLEIVAGSDSGWMYAFYPNGTLIWRLQLAHYYLQDGIAIADIDGDGKLEGVVDCYDFSTNAVNLEDGSILWKNWGGISSGAVSIADIDNDDELEVMSVTEGNLKIMNGKYGYSESNIKVDTALHHGAPTLVDIDGDGFLEIIVGGRNSAGVYPLEYENKLVAISNTGLARRTSYKLSELLNEKSINWKTRSKNTLLSNYIVETLDTDLTPTTRNFANISTHLNFSLVGDDLENDGNVGVVGVSNVSVYLWNSSGYLVWNSTIGNSTNNIVGPALIADPNDDNIKEIIVSTKITLFILNASNGNIIWNYTHSGSDVNSGYVVVLDFDGDNQSEILYNFFQYYRKSLVIKYNKTLVHNSFYATNRVSADVPFADFNKDGIIDGVRIKTLGSVLIESQDDGRIIASTKVDGMVITSSMGDINGDNYSDIVVGTIALASNTDTKANPASLYYGGWNSGIWGITYNHSNQSLNIVWNFSSANISSEIAIGDLTGDGTKEVIYGDVNNSLFCVRADNGSLVWNTTLPSKAIYSPMITNFGNQKVVIATTNSSIFIFNSSGGLIYNYNDSSGFSYSPIILDLEKRGKGSLLVGTFAGNITLINFTSTSNLIGNGGSVIINVSNISYSLNQLGRSLVRDIEINLSEYSTSRVVFDMDGDTDTNVTLTDLNANQVYTIKNIDSTDLSESYQYISSDNNGDLTFDAILGSLHTFDVYPRDSSTASETITSGSGGSPTFYPKEINLIEGYNKILYKNWKIQFNIDNETHTLNIDDVQNQTVSITISSTPQTKILSVGESWKVELTGDNYYDVEVILNNIAGNSANITMKKINELIIKTNNDSINGDGFEKDTNYIKDKLITVVTILICFFIIGIIIKLFINSKNKKLYK